MPRIWYYLQRGVGMETSEKTWEYGDTDIYSAPYNGSDVYGNEKNILRAEHADRLEEWIKSTVLSDGAFALVSERSNGYVS